MPYMYTALKRVSHAVVYILLVCTFPVVCCLYHVTKRNVKGTVLMIDAKGVGRVICPGAVLCFGGSDYI